MLVQPRKYFFSIHDTKEILVWDNVNKKIWFIREARVYLSLWNARQWQKISKLFNLSLKVSNYTIVTSHIYTKIQRRLDCLFVYFPDMWRFSPSGEKCNGVRFSPFALSTPPVCRPRATGEYFMRHWTHSGPELWRSTDHPAEESVIRSTNTVFDKR